MLKKSTKCTLVVANRYNLLFRDLGGRKIYYQIKIMIKISAKKYLQMGIFQKKTGYLKEHDFL